MKKNNFDDLTKSVREAGKIRRKKLRPSRETTIKPAAVKRIRASLEQSTTSQPTTQSAAERRAAEAELSGLIAKFAPAHLRLIAAVRRWLRKRLPTAHEVVYEYRDFFVISYSPNEHGYEGVIGVRASANEVGLWFNGAKELPDPEKLLRGSGKQTRSIQMEGASTLARPAVVRLIEAAIARTQVPFARTGRGPVVIRPTSAKKRRQGRHA